MTDKTISKNAYVWGHVAVIVYHILTAIILILTEYVSTLKKHQKTIVVTLASILLIVSVLSIWPIAKNYNVITIN